ncbi:alkaline phosphatase PhoX [Halomicrobium salinisoli]|uniref:alkaline phosphatase PhoX n=1 Tax=Halomicrobium salinisoli TaxID=2878391 RepID=UPI001CF0BE56|nr:alkaline phosphatase PhoX [Halomicrobium salinisoli]
MVDCNRRNLMRATVAAALGASVPGVASADVEETDTPGAPSVSGSIKRLSHTAFGAEVTGPFVFENGTLLYSLQHPSRGTRGRDFSNAGAKANQPPYDRAGVGYFEGFSFEFDGDNDDFEEVSIPRTVEEQGQVRSADHEFVMLAQAREPIQGGDERLGVTQTPDGTDVTRENFDGTMYGAAATNPDCNQFVPTNDDGTEGYLFTNWENSPGNITRVPISYEDGAWEADVDEALNLANTEPLREQGGTRINCYGNLTPWGTMLSAEENYAHTRVSLKHTVGDVVENGSGQGLIGGCQFWNRPNPSECQNAVDDLYGDESWTLQGYWALDGVEFLAYQLGAEPVARDNGENPTEPISDVYPNPYRYGYFVDVRQPTAETPQPVKYWVMGRAAWECPDVMSDERTVYGASDGDSKGIYKFVADEPIPSYDDPMDVAGTLYAPKITNDAASAAEAGERKSPADVTLSLEWIPLGHATNREVESWIAEYDDVTQADYLAAHADWSEGDEVTPEVLAEADQTVVEEGNQNYVSREEIVEWAQQYEQRGPDGVDEDLRKVPFIETRAAAKEIGASIEFNKAEGVDSRDDAGPGDYVYFGISEFNDAMADDQGDLQLDRVDGGVVYRGRLDADYDVSRLEPVVVGPDFTDPAGDADDSLRNVDNVYVMRDDRVLLCEDGFAESGRSYPNDCLYVYEPNPVVAADSVAVRGGETAETDVTVDRTPEGLAGAELTVSPSDAAVASIEDVSVPESFGLVETSVSDDGGRADLRVLDVDDAVGDGGADVALATLTLSGDGTGTTDLEVSVESATDDDGDALSADTTPAVVVVGPPAVPGGRGAPTDPDGDGRYEDVNGNGRLDFNDVVLLFEQFDADAVRLNEAAYDFNENGQLEFDDVVELYEEI